jgi:hypothetical protein
VQGRCVKELGRKGRWSLCFRRCVRTLYKVNKLKGKSYGKGHSILLQYWRLKEAKEISQVVQDALSQIQGDLLERISQKERVIGIERARGYNELFFID